MPAADNLAALVEPLEKIITEEGLTELPGVGEAIADIITASPDRHLCRFQNAGRSEINGIAESLQ
jgi:DNA polymerase/3'-5' exonuclease PolX